MSKFQAAFLSFRAAFDMYCQIRDEMKRPILFKFYSDGDLYIGSPVFMGEHGWGLAHSDGIITQPTEGANTLLVWHDARWVSIKNFGKWGA